MSYGNNSDTDFIKKARKIVEVNLPNELFGVSELAKEMGISRSYLHRKIYSGTKLSVSRFIRQIRLKKAKELLRNTSSTVSEVAFDVGYSSVSYFSKCYHDFYGYSPGEEMRKSERIKNAAGKDKPGAIKTKKFVVPVLAIAVLFAVVFILIKNLRGIKTNEPHTLAVLPFEPLGYENRVSTDVTGLVELVRSGLTDLTNLNVFEMASLENNKRKARFSSYAYNEINAKYLVSGFYRFEGDFVKIQLIIFDNSRGKNIFSHIYNLDNENMMELRNDMILDISDKINASLTPEEKLLINKPPTNNKIALKYYSQGIEFSKQAGFDYMCGYQMAKSAHYLDSALVSFKQAVREDETFALAHANIAKLYHYKSIHSGDVYNDSISFHSNVAATYNPISVDVLIARGYYYRKYGKYELAIKSLEHALEINPNSTEAIGLLTNIYGFRLRRADKFVEYAMKGMVLNVSKDTAVNRTINYVAATALHRCGFFKEAHKYYLRSLDFKSNAFTSVTGETLNLCFEGNKKEARRFIKAYSDVAGSNQWSLEDYGYFCFLFGDFDGALDCYNKVISIYDTLTPGPSGRNYAIMHYLLSAEGKLNEAKKYLDKYEIRVKSESRERFKESIYFTFYTLKGDNEKAFEQLKKLVHNDLYSYSPIYQWEHSPLYENIRNEPEYKVLTEQIEDRFWAMHKRMKADLIEKNLLL